MNVLQNPASSESEGDAVVQRSRLSICECLTVQPSDHNVDRSVLFVQIRGVGNGIGQRIRHIQRMVFLIGLNEA